MYDIVLACPCCVLCSKLCCSGDERAVSQVSSDTCLSHLSGLLHNTRQLLKQHIITNGTGAEPAGGVAVACEVKTVESDGIMEDAVGEKKEKKKRKKKSLKQRGHIKEREKELARLSQAVECTCQGLQLLGNIWYVVRILCDHDD